MKKIVLYSQAVQPRVVDLIAAEPSVTVAADLTALGQELKDAEGLIIQDPAWSADVSALASAAKNLHWVQLLTAGYDHLRSHGAPPAASITNARGAFSPAVAVHAVRPLPVFVAQRSANRCTNRKWSLGSKFCSKTYYAGRNKGAHCRVCSIGQEIAHCFDPLVSGLSGPPVRQKAFSCR